MDGERGKVSAQTRGKEKPGTNLRMKRGSDTIPSQDTRTRGKNRETKSENLLESSSSMLAGLAAKDLKNIYKKEAPLKIYLNPSQMKLPTEKVWLDLQPSSARILAPRSSRDVPKSRRTGTDVGPTLRVPNSVGSISLESIPSTEQLPNDRDRATINIEVSSIFGEVVEGTSTPKLASASRNLGSSEQFPTIRDKAPSTEVISTFGAGINRGVVAFVESTSTPNLASASKNLAISNQHPNVRGKAPSTEVSPIFGAGGWVAAFDESTSTPNVASASQNLASSDQQQDPQSSPFAIKKKGQKDDTEHADHDKSKFDQVGISKALDAEAAYSQSTAGSDRSAEKVKDDRIYNKGRSAARSSTLDIEKHGGAVDTEAAESSIQSEAKSSQSIASSHGETLKVNRKAVKMPHDRARPNSTMEDRRADGSKSNLEAAISTAVTHLRAPDSVSSLRSNASSYQDLKTPKDQVTEDGERDSGLLFTSSQTGFDSQCRIDKSDVSGVTVLDSKRKVFESALKEMSEKSVDEANKLHRTPEYELLDVMESQEWVDKSTDQAPKVKIILEEDLERNFFLDSDLNVREAKAILAQQLGVDSMNITLMEDGRVLSESEMIRDFGRITIKKGLSHTPEYVLDDGPGAAAAAAEQSKVVKVKVLLEDGTWKHVDVSLVVFGGRKQYIGGYRDKRNGRIYYHGISQTEPRRRKTKSTTREVQACLPIKDVGVNTFQAGSTQTNTKELCSLSISDKILSPRAYVPYNEVVKTMVPYKAARIIQKAWRKHIFDKFIINHFKRLAASLQEKAELHSSTRGKIHARRLKDTTAAIFPSHRSHFSDALAFVSDWAKQTAWQLANTKTPFARKAALSQMLDLEQKMLYNIERQRLKAVEENLRKQDMMFLEGTARPRASVYDKGNVTIIDDLNIQKANAFKEIFASYTRTDTSTTERLEVLNCLRDMFLQEFSMNNETVTELVDILNREIDLLTMGFPKAQLVYLRKRFETHFLRLSKDPEVNPQAKYFRKSHITEKKFAIRRCKFCNKNLTSSLMVKHIRMRSFKICKSCVQLKHNATNQLNLGPYQRMLEVMRAKELENNCRSSIPFLIQPFGAYFLVNKIWNGKSILSGNNDITHLKMTRWLPNQDWSVWNMILLTEKEAVDHDAIPDPLAHYSEDFILQVRTRNILGRMHFRYLVDIDNDFKFGRQPGGIFPRDHKLYTNKFHEQFIPSDPVPGFFKRGEKTD